MSIKKLMLLVVGALAAMAFAMPAAASASGGEIVDVDTGKTAELDREITFTGTDMFFETELGGYENCHMHGDAKVENATANRGSLQNVTLDTGSCEGTGFFAGCEVTGHTVEGEITVTPHDIDLLNVVIDGTNDENCVFEDVDLTFPNVTVTPQAGSGTSLDDMTVSSPLSAGGVAHINDIELEAPALAGGTLEAWGEDAGTWRIDTDPPTP